MKGPLTEETRPLTDEEQTFIDARSEGKERIGWGVAVVVVAFSVGLPGIPFALGDLWFGTLMTVITVVILTFLWNERLTDLPDLEEPVVTSWTGELTQKATRLGSARFWFGGRRVHLPDHWVDLIPGERTFGGEAAVLPDEKKPFLLKTSTGLSVEKEIEWGLLDTFPARPQRRILFYFGGLFLLFYLGIAEIQISESKPILEILLLGRISILGLVITGGALLLGVPGLYYFGKHRLALWRIRRNYWKQGVEGMPDREAYWQTKWRQVRNVLGLTVPGTALFLWLLKGLPILGAVLGVLIGCMIGYSTRVVRPRP